MPIDAAPRVPGSNSNLANFKLWATRCYLTCLFVGILASQYQCLAARCTTDANAVGVENIAITFVDPSVAAPTHKLSANDVAPECDGMLSPTDVFVVKGWSRGISLLTILLAAFESPEFHQVPQGEGDIFFSHSELMHLAVLRQICYLTESEALPRDIKENLSSTTGFATICPGFARKFDW